MKKILLILFYWSPFASFAQLPRWQQRADNRIDVSLNDIEQSLDGFISINYKNNSPDTLYFIWFHLWPDAFKTDRSAFSEQQLLSGKTGFYFSDKDHRGYINRLDFRVDGIQARTEDHPLYLEITKLILPRPLSPGQQIEITTPFHIKLPYNFSGFGREGKSYQITHWFPQPAVYDASGWHEQPYLSQGGYYGEFGSFDVRITVPADYIVAASGNLKNPEEAQWLSIKASSKAEQKSEPAPSSIPKSKSGVYQSKSYKKPLAQQIAPQPLPLQKTKTIHYVLDKADDFAWLADRNFFVALDSVRLPSGKQIAIQVCYLSEQADVWKKILLYIKESLLYYSDQVGDYPYDQLTVTEAKFGTNSRYQFPGLTCVPATAAPASLYYVINKMVGLQWFHTALATDETQYLWMTEGLNELFAQNIKQPDIQGRQNWLQRKIPSDLSLLLLQSIEDFKEDQPIQTATVDFNNLNYRLVPTWKTSEWLDLLENEKGKNQFLSSIKTYYQLWQFGHPMPGDFRNIFAPNPTSSTDSIFSLLNRKGALTPPANGRKLKPAFLFNLNNSTSYDYISILPAFGYNYYDGLQLGAIIHDYNLPMNKFQFLLIPLYAINSKALNGIANLNYSLSPENGFRKITLGLLTEKFSTEESLDTNGNKSFQNFSKWVPSLRFFFRHNPLSTVDSWIDLRTYLIYEKDFSQFGYIAGSDSSITYPIASQTNFRYINQVSFNYNQYRALYPYNYQFLFQQGDRFFRIDFNGNYFFNYSKGGGFNARLFASKFSYIGGQTYSVSGYEPQLLAGNGLNDYTYSNYFIGRTASPANPDKPVENDGLAAQQIMIRDGGLKFRMDLFPYLQGSSDNWVASVNMSSTLPESIIPKQIPLKVYFDIGSYADAWGNNALTSKFLYVGGLQLSLLRKIVNVYIPLIYSSDFRTALRSFPQENTFWKKVFFSIDIQNINLRKINRDLPF